MKRTIYVEDTSPTEEQFNYTEESKVNAILERLRSSSQFGVVEGFQITVNSLDATKIDIGHGEGYTGGHYKDSNLDGEPAGERISTLTQETSGSSGYVKTAEGVSLADYTSGVKNYVSLVYTETSSTPLRKKHFPRSNVNTLVRESYTVNVLSESDWNDLTLSQIKQRVLVAIITANGAGTSLTSSNIQQVVQPKSHPFASQPSNITGVTVDGISQETRIGTGTLRFSPTNNAFYWTAPGDAEGSALIISSSGVYTLYSDNVVYWIRLDVVFSDLPTSEQSDSIIISSLYGQEIPRFSAVDSVHRDMIGSGTPSENNVHGTTLDDIEGGTLEHADLFHVNGISVDADDDQLFCTRDMLNDRILIESIGGYNNNFLIDGNMYDLVSGTDPGEQGAVSFDTSPAPDSGVYLIYLNGSAEPNKVRIGEILSIPNIRIVDMANKNSGVGTISWTEYPQGYLTYQAPGDAAGDPVYTAPDDGSNMSILNHLLNHSDGYYKLYSGDTDNWVIVYCDGALGATASDTFDVDMNETEHSEELILKLCSVLWNSVLEQLTEDIDIRSRITADVHTPFLNEHDEQGGHTKPIAHQMQIAASSDALIVRAYNNSAIVASAFRTAIWGMADTSAICGYASTQAVYGLAAVNTGVYGGASTSYGVQGAANVIGVGGIAHNTGVYGSAYSNTGVGGVANSVTGVYGSAPNIGIYGEAATETGVYGSALTHGGYFEARDHQACYGEAGETALFGFAATIGVKGQAEDVTGVFGYAPETGVFGSGINSAVVGECSNQALYGSATLSYGVIGLAALNYGGSFKASGVGLAASATGAGGTAGLFEAVATGVYASASTLGVYGRVGVAGGTGVYGSGVTMGVYGRANTVGVKGSGNLGVYCIGTFAYDVPLDCQSAGTVAENAAICISLPSMGATAWINVRT